VKRPVVANVSFVSPFEVRMPSQVTLQPRSQAKK
jgi:hypothetical protein